MYILLKTIAFPLLSAIGLWNWASSVGGRKKHEFALFLLHSALCLRPPLLIARGGHAQLFLSPQSQFHNLKEELPQSQFHNF